MTNHNYFSEINTEFKAYILGFIYADGCLIAPSCYGNKPRAGRLSLSIQIVDEDIIDRFSQAIREKPGIVKYSPAQQRAGEQAQKIVNISSAQIYDDLVALGCYPRKTIVGMKFPNIEEELIPHFIRGFFDGNGCLTIGFPKNSYVSRKTGFPTSERRKKIRARIAFTSTDKAFILKIASYFNIEGCRIEEKTKTLTTYTMWMERQPEVLKILHYMYKDATVFLQRKKDKMNMLISSQAGVTIPEGSETT